MVCVETRWLLPGRRHLRRDVLPIKRDAQETQALIAISTTEQVGKYFLDMGRSVL